MNSEQNTKIAQQAYQLFQSQDIQGLLGLMSDDISWDLPQIDNVPITGSRSGRDSVGEFFRLLDETQSVRKFEPREFIAQNDKVVALGEYEWTVKATKKDYSSKFAHVFTIRDGKVVGFREYFDSAAIEKAYTK